MQPIRIRYGFECLAGRDFFAVHLNVLNWLENIGFNVQKETLSRVDLQVMLTRDISELMMPVLFANQCVKRARNHKIIGSDKRPVTSYTVGGSVQLCIYDKRKELLDTCDEVKMVSVHGGELGLTRGIDFVKIRHGCERPNHCQTSSKSCRA